jgi:hypothetical protein
MNDDPRSPAGDFIRALRSLDADAKTIARLAALLGVAWQAAEIDTPVRVAAPPPPPPSLPTPEPPSRRAPVRSDVPFDAPATVVPATLTPLSSATIAAVPAWLKQLTPLQPAPRQERAPEPAALLPPGQYRGILSTLLSTTGDQGPINLEQVVRAITRGQAIRVLPRRPTSTMARGIQLLVDGSAAMMPFTSDIARLEQDIGRLCGDAALDVVDFAQSPLLGAGRRTDAKWRRYGEDQKTSASSDRPLLPQPGTRIVCVTDLGIGRVPAMTPVPSQGWLDFARVVRQAGCPLVFLVPYRQSRWLPALRRALSIVHWDRATTAAVVARVVRGRLWRRRSSW